MTKYTCERCLKEFSQKSHFNKHQNKKLPCQDNKGKIEEIVENFIINKKLISNNTENIITNTMESPKKNMPKSEIKSIDEIENIKTQRIINEDCVTGMKKMEDDSVDIIICDPPYNIGKDFGNNSDKQKMDEYLIWCDTWINECIRILKPQGTLYIYGFSEILAFKCYCDIAN